MRDEMGRRLTRAESRELTRSRLLDAASVCFAERGFHGTTVEAIVSRSGYSRGAFYSNFSDLDELFLALLEQRMDREATEIATLLSGSTSGAHLLSLLYERRATAPDDPNWRLLLSEFRLHALRDADLRPKLAAREQRLRDQYRAAVDHVIETTGFDGDFDRDLLALIVQVLEDGLSYYRILDPEAVPSGTFIKALRFLLTATAALARETTEASLSDQIAERRS
jgi:AcrR family transcriptional regulator